MKWRGVKNCSCVYEMPPNLEYIISNMLPETIRSKIKFVTKEDINVYSINEAFLDITEYMSLEVKPLVNLPR